MRFLHLSDLHLGKRVCEFSMVDGVLLAGDLYDKPVPPAEAVRLLDWFLTQLAARKLPVFAISGNHDSADRVAFGSALLADSRVYVSPVFTGAPQPIPRHGGCVLTALFKARHGAARLAGRAY